MDQSRAPILVDKDRLSDCADLLMTTSPNVMVYAAIDGWRRHMVQRGHELLTAAMNLAKELRERINQIPDVEVLDSKLLGEQASYDLDRLQILMDISATGTSGYQGVDWLREHCHIDLGEADHRRMLATLSFADGKDTGERLVEALTAWRSAAENFDRPPQVHLPTPDEIQLDTVQLPRDAFFGPTEMVPADEAAGRVAAEQLTPYPPGIPVVVPGERLNHAVVDYLRSGLAAGMAVPDASDSKLDHFKVVADRQ